jgi:hypothetical protein
LHTGHTPAVAFTAGYSLGFWVIAGFAAAGVAVALVTIPTEIAAEPAILPAEGS